MSALRWLTLYGAAAGSGSVGRISIETIDNPGWLIKASLAESGRTDLDVPLTGEADESPTWMLLLTHDGKLLASGGPAALPTLIKTVARLLDGVEVGSNDQELDELVAWYESWCDGDWEHGNGLELRIGTDARWSLDADLSGTDDEERTFEPVEVRGNDQDWMTASMVDGVFRAQCAAGSLIQMIRAFVGFVERRTP